MAPPRVTDVALKPGETFRYQASVEIKPKVDPQSQSYEGLDLKTGTVDVSDSAVDQEIDKIRESAAQFAPIEDRTTAQEGDHAIADFDATVDGVAFPGSKRENAPLEVGSGEFFDGKAAGLAGSSLHEPRTIEYVFPKDYYLPELAGKTAVIKATLKALRSKKLPADSHCHDINESMSCLSFGSRRRNGTVSSDRR